MPWIEGDNLHSEFLIANMSTATPLSDEDRWSWLETVKTTALLQLIKEKRADIIGICSALKRAHRVELRKSRVLKAVFVMLQGSQHVLKQRTADREGHYMGTEIVESQLESLESPGVEETGIIPVDVTVKKEEVVEEVLGVLGEVVRVRWVLFGSNFLGFVKSVAISGFSSEIKKNSLQTSSFRALRAFFSIFENQEWFPGRDYICGLGICYNS